MVLNPACGDWKACIMAWPTAPGKAGVRPAGRIAVPASSLRPWWPGGRFLAGRQRPPRRRSPQRLRQLSTSFCGARSTRLPASAAAVTPGDPRMATLALFAAPGHRLLGLAAVLLLPAAAL